MATLVPSRVGPARVSCARRDGRTTTLCVEPRATAAALRAGACAAGASAGGVAEERLAALCGAVAAHYALLARAARCKVAFPGAKAARGARGARVALRALPRWQLPWRAPVRLRACAGGCARARKSGLTCGVPCCTLSQEPPPPDDFMQASGKVVAQVAPFVAAALALSMLFNLLFAQPLKEVQAQMKESQAQLQAQMKASQVETNAQLTLLQATLQQVPVLTGKVDILQDNSRSLLERR